MSEVQVRQVADYLNDILESISHIREFIQGMTYDDFIKDKKRSMQLFEALKLSEKRPETPLIH